MHSLCSKRDLLLIALLCTPSTLSCQTATARTTKPNVVVILADDLGCGDMSLYDGWVATPRIDRMAAQGVKFTDFHSNSSVCSPTRIAFLTGRYQQRVGIVDVIVGGRDKDGLEPGQVSIASLMKKAGYRTAIFGKWHCGTEPRHNLTNHGFDEFKGFLIGGSDYHRHRHWRNGLKRENQPGYSTHVITDHSVDFIERNKDRPFFLYVSHAAVHNPYQTPADTPANRPEKRRRGRKFTRPKYKVMLEEFDKGVGKILDTLEALDLDERTLVFFFSDNGDVRMSPKPRPYRGGKFSNYEGGHRVPAVARWPGKIEAGWTSDELLVGMDLLPTILDVTGIEAPADRKLDGKSMKAHLLERADMPDRQVFFGYEPKLGTAMRDGSWKMQTKGDVVELYDLSKDIKETTNVADRFPERARTMKAAIEEWKSEVTPKQRPNILFIMSDDHCARGIGCYGSRLAKLNPTPTIDRLAKEGMRFDNVFCTNSICTPSRANIITGQYCRRNGVLDLYGVLSPEKHYLPREMRRAGYTTAVVGKWHLKHDPRYFDYYCVLPGQGRYFDPILYTNDGGEKRKVRFDSTLSREVSIKKFKGHSSDVLTDITIEWLRDKRDKSKPFFLMHHYKAPHDMFRFAKRYAKYLEGVEIPEPSNMYDQPGPNFGSVATRGKDDSLVGVIGSSISKRGRRNYGRHYGIDKSLSDREYTHRSYQRYARDYLRCVKGVDDNLARLFAWLRDNDLMDDTVIVYTGDQGMMLGEHDYMDKRWMYEESMRMPLIIRYPKLVKAGTTCDWLINNTDFAPTLLALAGIETPDYMQGRSFAAALREARQPADWRTGTYYRYWMHMAHGHNNPAHFGIRTRKHKLIFYYGCDFTDVHGGKKVTRFGGNRYWRDTPAAWEFYDLSKDPREMHNRYDDPEYAATIAALKKELRATRERLGETDEAHPRIQKIIDAHWDR